MMRLSILAVLGLASMAAAGPAIAASTIELNTGEDWRVFDPDPNPGEWQYVEVLDDLENQQPNYAPAIGESKWIRALGNPASGTYSFRGIINLENVGSIQTISATWRADNFVTEILLNGDRVYSKEIPSGKPDQFSPGSEIGFFELDLSSTDDNKSGAAWKEGDNRLIFKVFQRECCRHTNDLALTASVMGSAVPEPGTWMLMIFGLGAVGFAMRRRAKPSVEYKFA